MSLPHMAGAVRSLLVSDAAFTALVPAARVVTRKPSDVTTIHTQVQIVGNAPIDASARAYSPLVQVTTWLSLEGESTQDPERTVWAAAATAADVLSSARAQMWQGAGFNLRVVDGPMLMWDDSRSGSAGLVGALIRVELRVHA